MPKYERGVGERFLLLLEDSQEMGEVLRRDLQAWMGRGEVFGGPLSVTCEPQIWSDYSTICARLTSAQS